MFLSFLARDLASILRPKVSGAWMQFGIRCDSERIVLQGLSLSSWQAPRLTNLGGSLSLEPSCSDSEAPAIRALW